MSKSRVVNLWYMAVSLGSRKTCPQCKEKLHGRPIYGWYEYHNVKQYLVGYFCQKCFDSVVCQHPVIIKGRVAGVQYVHNMHYSTVPAWLVEQWEEALPEVEELTPVDTTEDNNLCV